MSPALAGLSFIYARPSFISVQPSFISVQPSFIPTQLSSSRAQLSSSRAQLGFIPTQLSSTTAVICRIRQGMRTSTPAESANLAYTGLVAEVEKPRQPLLAMVALAKPVVPDREKLESFFEKAWPKGPSLEILEQEGDTISFGLSGERGKVALVNQPIPLAELEWPAQLAWHWPEAWKKLKKHQAHVLVALAGREEEDVSLVSRYLALTRVVAAVAATTKAIGVYWGDAPAVASTEMFVLAARHATEQLLPLQLWINFNVLFDENERKLALATFGLEAFDMPEVEAVCGKRKGPEVMEIVAGVVLYLLRNGPVIEDGDFVPGPSGEKIKVTFGPSARGARKVMRLQLG